MPPPERPSVLCLPSETSFSSRSRSVVHSAKASVLWGELEAFSRSADFVTFGHNLVPKFFDHIGLSYKRLPKSKIRQSPDGEVMATKDPIG